MSAQLMFEIDTSPKLVRAGLTRSLSSNIISDYPVPYPAESSRSTWSVPVSPVATIKRQHVEPDIRGTSPPKRPTCIPIASFTQSMAPVLSPFTIQRDKESFGAAVFGFKTDPNEGGPVRSQDQDAAAVNAYRSASPYSPPSDTFSPAPPSLYSSSSIFPDLAISPPDLTTFPFCHFEQVLSPSLLGSDPEFGTDDASGNEVSGCLISGCHGHGHDITHDQDGHPSPAVWTPSTLATMRKRWRTMRKQPPAQTVVPPRPCLKKMSALATDSFTKSSSSLESPHSAIEHRDFASSDNLENLRFHLDFSDMTSAEWSVNGGNRSRSTSGASSTMLFSPCPSDLEDRGLGNHTLEMAQHFLQDESLTEVEEYMLQGLLRAFSQPHSTRSNDALVESGCEASRDVSEDFGTTPTPASVLAQQNMQNSDGNDTLRAGSFHRRPTLSVANPTAFDPTPIASPTTCISSVDLSRDLSRCQSQQHSIVSQDEVLSLAEPAKQAMPVRPVIIDADAELDGEWQWACPITVPLPVRAGPAAFATAASSEVTAKNGQRRVSVPSRSNSVISSTGSRTGEKRRVHFPVCPGGNGEMALCALYPTYSATAYDRTPLEPPSEEEKSFRMPDRFSRDLTDEDAISQDIEDPASEHRFRSFALSLDTSIPNDSLEHYPADWDSKDHLTDFGSSTSALDWSCTNNSISDLPAHGQETMMTDDNWEDWLDQRKSACQLDSASTVTLKATFEEVPDAADADEQSTPDTTPLDCSPLTSSGSRANLIGSSFDIIPAAESQSPTSSLQSLPEQEAISSDTLSHTTASSVVLGTATSFASSCELQPQEEIVYGENNSGDDSWSLHASKGSGPRESAREDLATRPLNSIPKLKKKKKTASADKRTTLWTKTQSTWNHFGGSDSWSTGEEGCLGGF